MVWLKHAEERSNVTICTLFVYDFPFFTNMEINVDWNEIELKVGNTRVILASIIKNHLSTMVWSAGDEEYR